MGVTPLEFRRDLRRQKTGVPLWRCLRAPMFSRFARTLACDRRTDGQTQP